MVITIMHVRQLYRNVPSGKKCLISEARPDFLQWPVDNAPCPKVNRSPIIIITCFVQYIYYVTTVYESISPFVHRKYSLRVLFESNFIVRQQYILLFVKYLRIVK